jgi:DNA-binding helix-hairpin-helix protein with protein kinase domain
MLKPLSGRKIHKPAALSLRLKFIIVISLCLLVTMTASIWFLGTVQAKTFEAETRQRSEIVANFGEANRKFVSKHLRPTVEKYTKDHGLNKIQKFFEKSAASPRFSQKTFAG